VDVSAMETLLGSMDRRAPDLVGHQYTGEVGPRTSAVPKSFPWAIYPCKDGYIDIVGGGPYFFPRTARMLGMPELTQDLRYVLGTDDAEVKDEFEAKYWYPWIIERTREEFMEAAQREGVPSAPVNTIEEVLNDTHFKERGFWVEIDHPMTGKVKYPGAPFRMSEGPWQIRRTAPLLGEHNEEVYSKMQGYTKQDLVKLRERGII